MPDTLHHVCCCGKRWRAIEGRDRSCASDPGPLNTPSWLDETLSCDYMVARSMSECHREPVDPDRSSQALAGTTWPEKAMLHRLSMPSASGTSRSQEPAAVAQCCRSLLSLDVSGITCLCDAGLEALLCSHAKLVALAVSTGAAANAGMRAAAGLCDLRHLDISFLGFMNADRGALFTSETNQAAALSETLTAICSAAAQRSAAHLEASQDAPDASSAALATLCKACLLYTSPSPRD